MYDIAQENRRLTEPLTKALKEVETLRETNHADALKHREARKSKNASQVHSRGLSLQLQARIESCIFDVQQKCLLLEKRVQILLKQLETKVELATSFLSTAISEQDAQLGEALSKLQQTSLPRGGVDNVFEAKNQQIKGLYYELRRLTKAHNSVVKAFQSKLAEFGIPLEQMGLPQYISKLPIYLTLHHPDQPGKSRANRSGSSASCISWCT